mmetsp:Transcript_38032/g.96244  ORF Transcript_38032/g.96244 Transcript_38032/m.96244 type:complete len:392 (+) Transcript_38032:675-1850(+)
MAQAAREEERAHVLGHHVVDVTLQQPPCLETLQELAGGQAVHVRPAHARLERHDHALEGGEHGAVHNPLVLRELAADGERGGDVRVVAVVLAAHVAHHHVTRLQLAVVGGARMAVVEHGAVGAGGADGRVGRVPAAAAGVAVVQEGRLQLVLHHARRAAAHHRDVSLARNLVRIAQRLDLHAGLVDSALGEDKVQAGGLHLKGIHPLKLRRRRGAPTVCVGASEGVQAGRLCGAQHRRHLVHVVHLVDPILVAVELRRVNGPHPNGVLGRQARHEEQRLARSQVDSAVEAVVLDAKEVLEVRLLPEDALHVGAVHGPGAATLHQDHTRRRVAEVLSHRLRGAAAYLPVHRAPVQPLAALAHVKDVRRRECRGGGCRGGGRAHCQRAAKRAR